jgi:hypothetical protein
MSRNRSYFGEISSFGGGSVGMIATYGVCTVSSHRTSVLLSSAWQERQAGGAVPDQYGLVIRSALKQFVLLKLITIHDTSPYPPPIALHLSSRFIKTFFSFSSLQPVYSSLCWFNNNRSKYQSKPLPAVFSCYTYVGTHASRRTYQEGLAQWIQRLKVFISQEWYHSSDCC